MSHSTEPVTPAGAGAETTLTPEQQKTWRAIMRAAWEGAQRPTLEDAVFLTETIRSLDTALVAARRKGVLETEEYQRAFAALEVSRTRLAELERELDEQGSALATSSREVVRVVGERDAAWRERDTERERRRALETLINTPEMVDFMKAVPLEAAHQRERWGSEHDAGKTDADWFWLIGYLAGKALHNPGPAGFHRHDDPRTQEPLYFTSADCDVDGCPDRSATSPEERQLHRIITVAAAAANWHSAKLGATNMRPGISTEARAALTEEKRS